MKSYKLIMILIILAIFTTPIYSQVEFTKQISLKSDSIKSAVYDGKYIWVKHSNVKKVSAHDPVNGEAVTSIELSQPGQYLSFDGTKLLITQNKSKKIMVVNTGSGSVEPYINLKEIQGTRDIYLNPLRTGDIMGITCSKDRIWVGCGAGYSSSIYEIDTTNRVVVSHRFSPNPNPVSLIHYKNNLWVIDPDNNNLRCLKGANQLVYNLKVDLGKNPLAVFEMDNEIYVVSKDKNLLKGIEKERLNALVPEKVDTSTISPYLKKKRVQRTTTGRRKVAFLISGDTAATGFNEFWTDVVIMYRILQIRGYNEIYVLYANGRDFNPGWSKYVESMTDFPATKDKVNMIFDALATGNSELGIDPLGPDDILFVYTFDHGASNGKLCLWNHQYYSPAEMAGKVKNINCQTKMFYMQQCFSGAFEQEFKKSGVTDAVIVTAASHREYAYRADTEKEYYNGKTFYHGEFNWHFMSALKGETPTGETVDADTNNDNKVTVLETFVHYKQENSQPRQTPKYHSNPGHLGNKTTP